MSSSWYQWMMGASRNTTTRSSPGSQDPNGTSDNPWSPMPTASSSTSSSGPPPETTYPRTSRLKRPPSAKEEQEVEGRDDLAEDDLQMKNRLLAAQLEREMKASSSSTRGLGDERDSNHNSQSNLSGGDGGGPDLVKYQRVRYYHKPTQRWIEEAHVMAVHLDDGPDRPYYTIRYYYSHDDDDDDDHPTTLDPPPQEQYPHPNNHHVETAKRSEPVVVEKQTTRDRLEPLPWDEEKTWQILSQNISSLSC